MLSFFCFCNYSINIFYTYIFFYYKYARVTNARNYRRLITEVKFTITENVSAYFFCNKFYKKLEDVQGGTFTKNFNFMM